MSTEFPFVLAVATVASVERVSPSFVRVTFSGADLADFGTPGRVLDQRIKLVFPAPGASVPRLAPSDNWYSAWLALPDDERGAMRTYSIRELLVTDEGTRLVVDFVLHLAPGSTGPASRWADAAAEGDELLVIGPRRGRKEDGGIEYAPGDARAILLAGDETAAPAIAVILEQLPPDARGTVVVELPHPEDAEYLPRHPGFQYRVSARSNRERHVHLVPAVEDAAVTLAPAGRGAEVEEIDVDADILWEVPRTAKGGAALKSAPLYSWLAGEASAIKSLRRHLVTELGVDRRAIAFMGYWRLGKAEN
jgi:NADPH-dependent ferric siderophore reductase